MSRCAQLTLAFAAPFMTLMAWQHAVTMAFSAAELEEFAQKVVVPLRAKYPQGQGLPIAEKYKTNGLTSVAPNSHGWETTGNGQITLAVATDFNGSFGKGFFTADETIKLVDKTGGKVVAQHDGFAYPNWEGSNMNKKDALKQAVADIVVKAVNAELKTIAL